MKKKKVEDIMEDFYQDYQDDPTGWSFWISPPPEREDFYEAYILHKDQGYFLKLDSIYSPNPVGVGAKLGIERDQLTEDLPEFGFRKFNREEVERFLKNMPKPEEYESGDKFKKAIRETHQNVVEEAMKKEPGPFEPLDEPGELAALGPYSSQNPLGYISEKQEEIRRELSKKLDRMIKRDYPGYY